MSFCRHIRAPHCPIDTLPVVGDSEELFKAEFGHVTFGIDQRVNVHEDVAAADDTIHLMYRVQHHLTNRSITSEYCAVQAAAVADGPARRHHAVDNDGRSVR